MSRRDTIIIAVLVNAGLLMVLFATAMRSNKKEESKELSQGTNVVKEEIVTLPAEPSPIVAALDPNAGKTDLLQETLIEGSDPLAFGDEMDIPLGPIEAVPASPVPVATTPQPVSVAASTPASTPAVQPAPAKKEEPATIITVTVKKGDALEKIARANHSSVSAIMKANNLTSSNLKIGQVLKVPTNGSTAVAKKESSAPKDATVKKAGADSQYYTVKEGDSPWLIANRNNVKLEELLKLNGMDEQKARKLKPGDRLRIR